MGVMPEASRGIKGRQRASRGASPVSDFQRVQTGVITPLLRRADLEKKRSTNDGPQKILSGSGELGTKELGSAILVKPEFSINIRSWHTGGPCCSSIRLHSLLTG
jgi:hypothetical protein